MRKRNVSVARFLFRFVAREGREYDDEDETAGTTKTAREGRVDNENLSLPHLTRKLPFT